MNTGTRKRSVVRGLVAALVVVLLAAPAMADWGRHHHDRDERHVRWRSRAPFWRVRRAPWRRPVVIYRTPPTYSYTYVSPYTYAYTYSTSYPTYTTYGTYPSYGHTYSTYSCPAYAYPRYYSDSSAGFHYNSDGFNIRIHVDLDD